MKAGCHVLVVSHDAMLLQTRQLILGAFFQVSGAGRVQEAESLLGKYAFDLIVICYSFSEDERSRILYTVEGKVPRPRVLCLRAAGTGAGFLDGDQEFMMEAGPYGLLKKCAELLGVELKAKPQPTRSRFITTAA